MTKRWCIVLDPTNGHEIRTEFKDLKKNDMFSLFEANGDWIGDFTAASDAYPDETYKDVYVVCIENGKLNGEKTKR